MVSVAWCGRCGLQLAVGGCVNCSGELVAYDRDGDALWGDAARYCSVCGGRLGRRAAHACEPPAIRFYGVSSEYGAFSNFAGYALQLEGKTWPTSEHYFQAQKFAGTPREELIRRARTPATAARLGRDRRQRLRRDWESVKVEVMARALRAKFTQHVELRELLLGTGEARLVEHTARDAFWGDGGDGAGKNWLGRLLMKLRADLRACGIDDARLG